MQSRFHRLVRALHGAGGRLPAGRLVQLRPRALRAERLSLRAPALLAGEVPGFYLRPSWNRLSLRLLRPPLPGPDMPPNDGQEEFKRPNRGAFYLAQPRRLFCWPSTVALEHG